MNYIIPESRLHQVIFKYLDMQNLIKTDVKVHFYDGFYFTRNKGDEYCIMGYNKLNGTLTIYSGFVDEVSNMFSLSNEEMSQAISLWIENDFDVEVTKTNVEDQKYHFFLP